MEAATAPPPRQQPPPQQPQQPDAATLGALAVILMSRQRPDVMAQSAEALLAPFEIIPEAVLVAFGLLWPNLEHDVIGAADQTALGFVLRTQVAREAAYIWNAAKRLTTTQDVRAEARYLRQHLLAERGRRDAAQQADKVAAVHGPQVGWYSVRDDRTSAGCRAMHGRNFDVARPPMVEGRPAYPGSVHPHCRCRTGPPHRVTSSVRVPAVVGLAFEERLHPRDPHGRFRDVADAHILAWVEPGESPKVLGDRMATSVLNWPHPDDAPPHDVIAKNWAKNLEGKISDNEEAAATVNAAIEENARNDLYSRIVAQRAPDNVIVINTPERGSVSIVDTDGAAHRVAATTLIREDSVHLYREEQRRGLLKPISNTDIAASSAYGLDALLRHEYGHSIEDNLDPETKRRLREALPDPGTDLSTYAGSAPQELVPELFAITTEPGFDPSQWPESVQKARAILFEAIGLDPNTDHADPLGGEVTDAMQMSEKFPGSTSNRYVDYAVKDATAAIDKVHEIPDGLPDIPVTKPDEALAAGASGGIVRTRAALDEPIRIMLDPDNVDAGLHTAPMSMVHELGHYLDLTAFKDDFHPGGQDPAEVGMVNVTPDDFFASKWAESFKPLRVALEKSDAIQQTRDLLATAYQRGVTTAVTVAKYRLSVHEQFARAYFQWIATRSGDEKLMDAVRRMQDDGDLMAWADDDFTEIAAEFDNLFRQKGLLREEGQPVAPAPQEQDTLTPGEAFRMSAAELRAIDSPVARAELARRKAKREAKREAKRRR